MRSSVRIAVSALVAGAAVAYAAPAYASTVNQLSVSSTGMFGGFDDVTSVSATDGWAVGGNGNGIVQRYNGMRWTTVPSPDLLTGGNTWAILSGVDSVSPSTAFAVGRTTGSSGSAAVALRWNGTVWSRQSGTEAGRNEHLVLVSQGVLGERRLGGGHHVDQRASQDAGDALQRQRLDHHADAQPGHPQQLGHRGGRHRGERRVGGRILAEPAVRQPDPAVADPALERYGLESGRPVPTTAAPSCTTSRRFATDAWAVGSDTTGALVARWNGTIVERRHSAAAEHPAGRDGPVVIRRVGRGRRRCAGAPRWRTGTEPVGRSPR